MLDALPLGLTLEELRHKCHYLILAMLRYYREEGLSAKWDDACARIQAVLPTVAPELTAQFHYERALFALFTLDLQQLTQRLAEWPRNNTLPFWEAKKASLLAEIGQVDEARHILRQSLDMIRAKLNLAPPKVDYTLVSQESFVMYLLHAVSQPSWLLRDSDQTTIQTQRREVFVYRVEARKSAKWCAGLVRMCRYVQYGSRGRQTWRFEGARARG